MSARLCAAAVRGRPSAARVRRCVSGGESAASVRSVTSHTQRGSLPRPRPALSVSVRPRPAQRVDDPTSHRPAQESGPRDPPRNPAQAKTDTRQRPRIHEQNNWKVFERINSMRETNRNFDSCNSRIPSRLHELHESKLLFVSRIKFIRSKFSIVLLMYPGSETCGRSVSVRPGEVGWLPAVGGARFVS